MEKILQDFSRTLEEAEIECQTEKPEVVTFNSGHGGTGVSETFEGVSQTDVRSVKTVTVQSTVTDEKRVSLCFSKNIYFMNNIQLDMTG